jgi:hypothetical protein
LLKSLTGTKQPTPENKFIIASLFEYDNILNSSECRLVYFPFMRQAMEREGSACFRDLIDRLSSSMSGNIFTSKETEMTGKIQVLRRMSFTSLCSPPNTLQSFWPIVQEKLIELLRTSTGLVAFHIFIFLRSCLFGLNSHTLNSLLPILHCNLTETLCIVSDSNELTEDILIHFAGICCFLDAIFLIHTSTAMSYLWGVASSNSNRGFLQQICERHHLEQYEKAQSPRRPLVTTSKPSSITDLGNFICGLGSRLQDVNSLSPLSQDELEELKRISVGELP